MKSIKKDDFIDPYMRMMRELPNINVSQNIEFQRVYRNYWAMNAALLNQEFYTEYFALLERSKYKPTAVIVENVARTLSKVPTNSKGKETRSNFLSRPSSCT